MIRKLRNLVRTELGEDVAYGLGIFGTTIAVMAGVILGM